MALFQQGYGLVIGVGDYGDPAWNVPIAARDAADLHAALTDPNFAAYPIGQVELLKPEEATRDGFANALGRLAARAGEDSTVFIAITCHGALGNDNLYYLAPRDVEFVDGEYIRRGTGYSIVQLANALKAIKAQRLLLVINACFSGNLGLLAAKGALREPGSVLPNSEGDRLLASGKGRALITASRAEQRSYFQPDESHSYFGQALIDAVRGSGVGTSDGTIGLYELYAAIYKQAQRVVGARGLQQEPLLSVVDGVGPFPIARHSSPVETGPQRHDLPAGAVREAPQTIYQQFGDQIDARGSQGFINQPSGPVTQVFGNQDNRKLIDFGSAQIRGGVTIGDVVQGDLTKTVYNYGGESGETTQVDPITALRKARERIETLSGLPEGLRDDAVSALDRAIKSAERGEKERAQRLAGEAADAIDQMGHPTATSIGKKVRAAVANL